MDQQGKIRWERQGENSEKKLGWVDSENLKRTPLKLSQYSARASKTGKNEFMSNGVYQNADLVPGMKQKLEILRQAFPTGTVQIEEQIMNAKILAIGQGFYNGGSFNYLGPDGQPLDKHEISNHVDYIRTRHTEVLADFALVKLDSDNCTCLQTAPLEDEKTMVVGFPGEQMWKFSKGWIPWNLREASFSRGLVCEPGIVNTKALLKALTPMQQVVAKIFYGQNMEREEVFKKAIYEKLKDKIIFHSATSTPGTSGGSVLNSKMKLSGINTSTGFNVNGTWDPFSLAIRIEHIQEKLKTMLTPEEYAEAFNCPD